MRDRRAKRLRDAAYQRARRAAYRAGHPRLLPGRPTGTGRLNEAAQAWLVARWDDVRLSDEDLCETLGIGRSSLWVYRMRLGLGFRPRHRKRTRTAGRNAGNRATGSDAAQRQLDRLERALALEELLAPQPRYRRCEVCQGCEDTTHPHTHAEAA